MSERGEVEVLLPVERPPATRRERVELSRIALAEARRLVAGVGGRVLGVSKIARAVDPSTGQLAIKVRFAVEAPESMWQRPKVVGFG